MAHFLILSSQQHQDLSTLMVSAALEVLCGLEHSFDKITVPSVYQLPFALNKFSEEGAYDGTICLGVIVENAMQRSDLHHGALLSMLYDYAGYFQHCVGIGIAAIATEESNDEEKQQLVKYATTVAQDVCAMLATERTFYSLDERGYGGHFQHN
jgi:6,7-dimethyl-8-ribityllumazine synthase